MSTDDTTLREILLKENYVTEEDVKKAEEYAKAHKISFVRGLIQLGFLSNDLLGEAIAESFGVPYSDLNSNPPPSPQAVKIPEEIAKRRRVVFFSEAEDRVVVATDSPKEAGLAVEMKTVFPGKKVVVTYSLPEDIDASLLHYQKPLESRFSKIFSMKAGVAPELLEEIFSDAFSNRASDIHFEPCGDGVAVRFRVDGVLREVGQIPKGYYENILNRVKVQSGLRIDEHFAAQDGSLRFQHGGAVFDIRVSIVPTIEGEKIVLRALSAYAQGLGLSELGLSERDQKTLQEVTEKPFGMIVVAGPTGSGKTTTLYALLQILNSPEENITTIEDPVEYRIKGVNQIQVNQETNLTFAKGLRSIVRQDPDIILVGEIRDRETAEIAVNAALTGHLLLSTFHANDAATAIPRLLDMGIQPFLLASTLELVLSQRLVRKICDQCRLSYTPGGEDRAGLSGIDPSLLFPKGRITLYRGRGCAHCGGVGYRGRTAIFEYVRVSPEIKNLILKSPSAAEIRDLARRDGARSLFEDGMEKVRSGITTVSELLRVAEPSEMHAPTHGKKVRS